MYAADPRSRQLDELMQCAYRLGVTFGAACERAETHEQRMELFPLFDRCFFSVRVAIGLQLRLRREGPAMGLEREAPERDPADRDPGEAERAERLDDGAEREPAERDRDREGDREPASLPVLLRTLNGVVAAASALPGPEPAALPTLRELLAGIGAQSAAAATPAAVGLRARLAGSGAAPPLVLARQTKPGSPDGPPRQVATGPPRR